MVKEPPNFSKFSKFLFFSLVHISDAIVAGDSCYAVTVAHKGIMKIDIDTRTVQHFHELPLHSNVFMPGRILRKGFNDEVLFVNQKGGAIYMLDLASPTQSKLFSNLSKVDIIEDFGVIGAAEDTIATLSGKCWLCAWKVNRATKSISLLNKVRTTNGADGFESGCSMAVVPKLNLVLVHLMSKIERYNQPAQLFGSTFSLFELENKRFVSKGVIDVSAKQRPSINALAYSCKMFENLLFTGVTSNSPFNVYTIRYDLRNGKFRVVDVLTKKLNSKNMKIGRLSLVDGKLWAVNDEFLRVSIEYKVTN